MVHVGLPNLSLVMFLSLSGANSLIVTDPPLVTEVLPALPTPAVAISSGITGPNLAQVLWETTTYRCSTSTTWTTTTTSSSTITYTYSPTTTSIVSTCLCSPTSTTSPSSISSSSSISPTLTTPTVTTSPSRAPTATPAGACLTSPLCAPEGWNLDYYHNDFGGYSRQAGVLSNYYIVDRLTPLQSSLTNITFFPQDTGPTGLQSVYPNATLPAEPYYIGYTRSTNGGITVDANNFTLVYYGLYRAPATGAFQFCTSADNENDIYFGGDNAFSCLNGQPGTAADALASSTGGDFVDGVNCATVNLVEGAFYPVRNVMGNWQGPSAFNFTVIAPGVATADRTNDFSGTVYPHDCGIYV